MVSHVTNTQLCNPESPEKVAKYLVKKGRPSYRKVDSKNVQTPTQMIKTPVKTESSTTNVISPPKSSKSKECLRKKSNLFEYGSSYDDAMPGDIIMAFAGDIDHPAYLGGLVCKNYLVYGVVTGYVYVDWKIYHEAGEWDGTVRDCERLDIIWMEVAGVLSECWDIEPPFHHTVKVIVKKADKHLKGVNNFVRRKLTRLFTHSKDNGWVTLCRSSPLCEQQDVKISD